MTPKQKAEILVLQFSGANIEKPLKLSDYFNYASEESKKFALIAVDEIIGALFQANPYSDELNRVSYWNEVKQEIEKL